MGTMSSLSSASNVAGEIQSPAAGVFSMPSVASSNFAQQQCAQPGTYPPGATYTTYYPQPYYPQPTANLELQAWTPEEINLLHDFITRLKEKHAVRPADSLDEAINQAVRELGGK
jgi:hypothetical protein